MAKKLSKSQIRYEVISQRDTENDDGLVPIPPVVLEQLGWREGDEIEIGLDSTGKYIFTRVEKT